MNELIDVYHQTINPPMTTMMKNDDDDVVDNVMLCKLMPLSIKALNRNKIKGKKFVQHKKKSVAISIILLRNNRKRSLLLRLLSCFIIIYFLFSFPFFQRIFRSTILFFSYFYFPFVVINLVCYFLFIYRSKEIIVQNVLRYKFYTKFRHALLLRKLQ